MGWPSEKSLIVGDRTWRIGKKLLAESLFLWVWLVIRLHCEWLVGDGRKKNQILIKSQKKKTMIFIWVLGNRSVSRLCSNAMPQIPAEVWEWKDGPQKSVPLTQSDLWPTTKRTRPWPLRWVLGQGSLLPLSQGEAFTLASISYLAILVKYILAKESPLPFLHSGTSSSCRKILLFQWVGYELM